MANDKEIKAPKKKGNISVLLGAAFLMATSAIGPGFMTQTATFTNDIKADFAFVILVSMIMSYIAQLNVWRVIVVSDLRGQDIANKVLPGLGYVIAFLVALGGLAFNIGNIGGFALGMSAIAGFSPDNANYIKLAAAVGGIIGIFIFTSKSAGKAMDKLTQILGGSMIILMAYVCAKTHPPVMLAVKSAVTPSDFNATLPAILTLLGGTVGGYIVFSGGHRLLDAGISGKENLAEANKSATTGIIVVLIVRVLLFLAVLGVVTANGKLTGDNIAATAFRLASGEVGAKIFGFVFAAAALTSIVGAAFTSVSFLKTLFKSVGDNVNKVTILFIIISTVLFIFIGKPQKLLVLVGALNGLILPVTLAVILIASKKKSIVGDYKHSNVLFVLGWLVTATSAYLGVKTIVTLVTSLF